MARSKIHRQKRGRETIVAGGTSAMDYTEIMDELENSIDTGRLD
jgi:hypothetical protein